MKTAIITGADGGMGQEETLALAKAGFCVVMACKNPETAFEVCEKIKQESRSEHIFVEHLDLSNFESIALFCNSFVEKYKQVNVLINNAGVLSSEPKTSANGYELMMATNFLGHFLLTNKLLPFFAPGSKVINMVSLTYKYGKLKQDSFLPVDKKRFNRFVLYSNSKMALFYATKYWSEEWKSKGFSCFCVDPGIVNTNIIKMNNKLVDPLCDIFYRPLIRSPKKGAQTVIWLALDEAKKEKILFKDKKPLAIKPSVLYHDCQKQLIEEAKKITEKYL